MSKVALSGNPLGSGTFTIASPNSNNDRTLTLPDATGTVATTANIPAVASTAEAQAGTNNTNFMTPLRTAEQRNATALGWGQTWQNVTGSRTLNTVYTNTTGRPIAVSVIANLSGSTVGLNVDGLSVVTQGSTAAGPGNVFAIVPNNSTYQLVGVSPASWFELR